MEWALALVAVALLGVAAVSRRLAGTPITPAILFVAFGLLVGPEGARRGRPLEHAARPCASWRRRRLRWCSSATPRASTWVNCGVPRTCRCGCSGSGCR